VLGKYLRIQSFLAAKPAFELFPGPMIPFRDPFPADPTRGGHPNDGVTLLVKFCFVEVDCMNGRRDILILGYPLTGFLLNPRISDRFQPFQGLFIGEHQSSQGFAIDMSVHENIVAE
jgi:hypothetical protein